MKSIVSLAVSFCLCFNLVACGTIIHPERKGQVDGRIDVGIAVLDAIGLLFFFIPGVVAFAVDFSNGTIYLPGGHTSTLTPQEMDKVVKDGKVDKDALEQVLRERDPELVSTDSHDWQVERVDNEQSLAALFKTQHTASQSVAMVNR
ncbi:MULTISPECIES: hypothetical protein [Vibrio]|uniref:Uncharacterized protein n=2 Tax=Vibrio TaxID=662 RepID=A0A7X4LKS5_9VIBR|nr:MULTISPECIES: hypothetical protein [Vibrio]MBF9000349.1 hypothetical protein [Vibrio nitrifigilis]MZI93641.1 hypothetical protein [Vibrio eleionomae]